MDYAAARVDYVIGCNDAYRIADLDVLYAADLKWWQHHWEKVKDLDCIKVKPTAEADLDGVVTMPSKCGTDMTDKVLNHGSNSGFQLLHLALLWGAKRVFLLGYDLKRAGGKWHWFGNHPDELQRASNYQGWIDNYTRAKLPPVPIFNCSPDTAIRRFPRVNLRDVL